MPLKTFTAKNFFDRSNELAILKGVASEALAGDATDVFLSGKWGIGKTELLKHLFNHLFWKHNYVIPFFYTINSSCTSIEDFSRDYLNEFLLQSIAYLKKDYSIMDAGTYSLEDLKQLAGDSDAGWVVKIIDDYNHIREQGDPVKLFTHAVLAPYSCYLNQGMPVMVMIDNFHRAKELHEFDHGDNSNFWVHFEKAIRSRYTPHIFTGFQPELYRMLFEETSFGEHLELVNLSGLGSNESKKYFMSLCELYDMDVEEDLKEFIDTFKGNPFYIKSFAQAARQAGKSFSVDDCWNIYIDEITKGKIFRYWTTRLKTYISKISLRKASLGFLQHLEKDGDVDFSGLAGSFAIHENELEYIVSLLHASGIVETGFSLIELADDQVLLDVLKGLYHREIKRDSSEKVRELIMSEKQRFLKVVKSPSFEITIPYSLKSELVAIKSLQQIARHYNIPADITGQLQFALVELFTGVLSKDIYVVDSYDLKFRLNEKKFYVDVILAVEEFAITADDSHYVKEYVDSLKVERILGGVRITLLKELREDLASAS
ncbi:MAG: ATP-binding protein [Nitrospirota bacterium]